jgi:hypothetical protein
MTPSERFRERAYDCRLMAEELIDGEWKTSLLDMADAFEQEADRLEREQKQSGPAKG